MGICWLAGFDSYNSKTVLYSAGQWQGAVQEGPQILKVWGGGFHCRADLRLNLLPLLACHSFIHSFTPFVHSSHSFSMLWFLHLTNCSLRLAVVPVLPFWTISSWSFTGPWLDLAQSFTPLLKHSLHLGSRRQHCFPLISPAGPFICTGSFQTQSWWSLSLSLVAFSTFNPYSLDFKCHHLVDLSSFSAV